MIEPELPFRVEYHNDNGFDKNNKCQECKKKILDDELKISKIQLSRFYDGLDSLWFDTDCFFRNYNPFSFHLISNFDNLRWKDKLLVMNKIDQSTLPPPESPKFKFVIVNGAKAIQFVSEDNGSIVETIRLECFSFSKMERQTYEFFDLRDRLQCLRDKELMDLMRMNDQYFPYQYKYTKFGEEKYSQRSMLLDAVTDKILFGALSRCGCRGYIVFEPNVGYKCLQLRPDCNNCQELRQTADRCEFLLSKEIRGYDFLHGYKREIEFRLTSPSIAHLKLLDLYEENEEIAVNTSCSIESWTDVFQHYCKVLVRTNIEFNLNQYWKIQVRKHRQDQRYWLVRNWGRIGTYRGNQTVEEMSQNRCIEKFNECYREKHFREMRGEYVSVEIIDFDIINWEASRLELPIRSLMKLIFNENVILKELKDHGIDFEKIPLGMLSEKQILKAKEALKIINDCFGSRNLLVGRSNAFYSSMPHGFGNKRPIVLDNPKALQYEQNLLEQLKMTCSFSSLDILFDKLDIEINVLDKKNS